MAFDFLMIPPSGLLNVFRSDTEINPHATLRAVPFSEGHYINLTIEVDGTAGGHVHWLANPTGPVNPRAREAFTMLTGTHMIFTGHVIFTGVPEARMGGIVAALSMRD